MVTKALPLFALLVCFALMAIAPARRFAMRVAIEVALLVGVGLPLLLRGARLIPNPAKPDEPWLEALAVVWWMVAARLVVTLVTPLATRTGHGRQERLFSDLVKAAIYLSTVLFVLNSVLQFPVQGLLATSGVIAIVLGLALQNTLADVFAGIAVGVEQPFHVGDEILVADHAEGIVVEMNWRSVRIQHAGDLAVIPNSLIAKGQITNRSRPNAHRAGSLEVAVEPVLPPEQIINLLKQALLLSPDLVERPPPTVHLTRLEAGNLSFTVHFSVASTNVLGTTRDVILRQISRQLRFSGVRTGHRPDRSTLLASLGIFDSLTDQQIAALTDNAQARRLDPGDILFAEGAEGRSLFIVEAGVLDVFRQHGGSERSTLGRVGPGEYIGEISLLSAGPHQVSAVALTACRTLELPRSALEALVRSDPALLETLRKSVARGLSALDRDTAARCAHKRVEDHQLLGWLRDLLAPRRTQVGHPAAT